MDLDFYSLRILTEVVRHNSFSAAASFLGVTQPTVSQQIAKLERHLGGKMFERVGHGIHLTPLGNEIQGFAADLLEKTDHFMETLKQERSQPSGLVRYAMPESCQWTPHYRKIMNQIREFPHIRFEIEILPNSSIVQGLLEAKLDFGFIVGDRLNPELRFEKFSDEHYSAVAADKTLLEKFHDPEQLRLISYPGWELFFTTWIKAHGLWNALKKNLALPTIKIGTLAGAIHAAQEGAGVAVIPTHCVMSELKSKRLFELEPKKGSSASNPVHVARRIAEKLPHRAELVLEMLRKAKAEIG